MMSGGKRKETLSTEGPVTSTTPPQARRRDWSPRRLYVPLVLLVLLVLGPLLPHIWHWPDLDPLPTVTLGVIGYWLFPACLIGLELWFVAFSGLPKKVRLWGFAAGSLLGLGFMLCVDDIKFNGRLRPF